MSKFQKSPETISLKNFQAHLSTGNEKVPYYIFNMGSASRCPSEKLGLCAVAAICYAKKAERMYKQVLPYRERQAVIWRRIPAREFVAHMVTIQSRSRSMSKVLRFSESGDFNSQHDVDKMAVIARKLKSQGWKVYGYTARVDLDLNELIKHAQVNLSNDSKEYQSAGANRFVAVDKPSGDNFVCIGDCNLCNVCLKNRSKVIEVIKH